jgi:molybdopterin-guanine dinucleotide biosynthesis protein A
MRNGDYDVVVPCSEEGQEPLHAVYSSACKDVFENAIQMGERKIVDILGRMNVRQVHPDALRSVGDQTTPFLNVNTPDEYEGVRTIR